MIASIGDYIIKGVNGEFYPCKPDIFLKTYERAETNRPYPKLGLNFDNIDSELLESIKDVYPKFAKMQEQIESKNASADCSFLDTLEIIRQELLSALEYSRSIKNEII